MFNLFKNSSTASAFRRIDVATLESMRKGADAPLMIDVREPIELTTYGKIPGVVNIPLGQLNARAAELPADKDAPIVLVCQSGSRSQQGAKHLAALGYRNLFSLDGGTLTWLRTARR